MLHVTTKYDGSLHYRFEVRTVFEDDGIIAVYREANVSMVSYRGEFSSPTHLVVVFYADRYHNIAIMWNEDWTPHMHYVNIATPASWDRDAVTAVDMDLDVLRRAGQDKLILDDEDEFEHHRDVMGYPDPLVRRCRTEVESVFRLLASREGLFSDAVFAWRPGLDFAPMIQG